MVSFKTLELQIFRKKSLSFFIFLFSSKDLKVDPNPDDAFIPTLAGNGTQNHTSHIASFLLYENMFPPNENKTKQKKFSNFRDSKATNWLRVELLLAACMRPHLSARLITTPYTAEESI